MAIRIDRPEPKGTSGGINLTTDLKDTRINATGALNTILGLVDRRREEKERQDLQDLLINPLARLGGIRENPAVPIPAALGGDAEFELPDPKKLPQGFTRGKEHGFTGSGTLADLLAIGQGSAVDPSQINISDLTKKDQFADKRYGITYLRELAKSEQLKEREELARKDKDRIAQAAATKAATTATALEGTKQTGRLALEDLKQDYQLDLEADKQSGAQILERTNAANAESLVRLKHELNPPQQTFQNLLTEQAKILADPTSSKDAQAFARGTMAFITRYELAKAAAGKPMTKISHVPAGALQEFALFIDLQKDLHFALASFDPAYTGPIDAPLGRLRKLTGIISEDEVIFQQSLDFLEEILSRAQTGAVISKEEVPKFRALIPVADDHDKVFIAKAKNFIRIMQGRIKTRVDIYRKWGFGNVPEADIQFAISAILEGKKQGIKKDFSNLSDAEINKQLGQN